MAECNVCGARVSPGEHFCGNCGTQLTPSATELETLSATLGDEVEVQPVKEQPVAAAAAPVTAHEPSGILETTVAEPESTGAAPVSVFSNSPVSSSTDGV